MSNEEVQQNATQIWQQ